MVTNGTTRIEQETMEPIQGSANSLDSIARSLAGIESALTRIAACAETLEAIGKRMGAKALAEAEAEAIDEYKQAELKKRLLK